MDMTNTGDLSIEKPRVFKVVDAGVWEAEYRGYRPYKEDSQWGPKEGVRLQFRITKGHFANEFVSFKGAYFQDKETGKFYIGRKSKLAEAIKSLTNGSETLNKGHEGLIVLVKVEVTASKKDPSKKYSNVTMIMQRPEGSYDSTPATKPAATNTAPAQAPAQPPATAATASNAKPSQPQVANDELIGGLDGLDDLTDFGK